MNVNSTSEIIADAELDIVFGNANFGEVTKREVIYDSLLKCLAGYTTGSTAKRICIELDLVYANKWDLTQKGRLYLYFAIHNE